MKLTLIFLFSILSITESHAALPLVSCALYATNGPATMSHPFPDTAKVVPGTEVEKLLTGNVELTFTHINLLNEQVEFRIVVERDLSQVFRYRLHLKNISTNWSSEVHFDYMNALLGQPMFQVLNALDVNVIDFDTVGDRVLRCQVINS